MKKPLLKILPGVAVVLISPSCSKDNDIITEDNASLVAEQVIKKKVFYLKINNASSLSKMKVAGLGEGDAGERALKFEIGDILNLEFYVNTYDNSGSEFGSVFPMVYEVEATCVSTDGLFEVNDEHLGEEAQIALQEMQDGVFGAADKYKLQLNWGNSELLTDKDFIDNGYFGFDDMTTMFKNAPRSAYKSYTLKHDGDYCFIVFEKGCTKTVEVNGTQLTNETEEGEPRCYIVSTDAKVTVDDVDKGKLKSGELYYVRKQTSNVEE